MKQNYIARAGVRVAIGMLLGALCSLPFVTQAASATNANPCMSELLKPLLTLAPKTANPPDSNGGFINRIASCNMWQNFFYLNWPAEAGQATAAATVAHGPATVVDTARHGRAAATVADGLAEAMAVDGPQ